MSAKTEEKLELQTKKILEYLKPDIRYGEKVLPRPFFIELTGSPSAGKTTIIKELDKLFRRHGLRVLIPQEGAEVIRHVSRSTPVYNVRTGLYALSMLIDQANNHSYDVIIFDRCIFDAYCWMIYWREKEKINSGEQKIIQSFFLSRLWTDFIDVAYFVVCDAKVAMKREQRLMLTNKFGETTNPKTLKVLEERYREAYNQLSPKYPQLQLIDTTTMSERAMVKLIAEKTLSILEERSHMP